ncbi:hypothetical protein AOQ84DRAFT_74259 [Glonium stellatum]|uniref:CHAT domain-containing protein n=1 Tax=Glonium stellatum TaxID=574774 RepID=A0A8E2FBJ0_9PEZI|nr:hypothetical protein AOQ84DRAFT_74259 [Glonium stellatum]
MEVAASEGLESVIQRMQARLNSASLSSGSRATVSFNLSLRLRARYRKEQSYEDLLDSIRLAKVAIDDGDNIRPAIRARRIYHLGIVLQDKYLETGSLQDLQAAIQYKEKGLKITPDDEKAEARISRIEGTGNAWGWLFQRTNDISDLEKGRFHIQAALDQTAGDDPARAGRLDSSGVVHRDLFLKTRNISHLEKSISHFRNALDMTPQSDPNVARRQDILGCVYGDRYQEIRSEVDLNDSIHYTQLAVNSTPKGHKHRAERLDNLVIGHQDRYLKHRSSGDLQVALDLFEESSRELNSPPIKRMGAASRALDASIQLGDWARAAVIVEQFINLLPLSTPRTNSNEDLQFALRNFSGIGSVAASVFIKAGKTALEALEMLERGRGIISSVAMELRSDNSSLKEHDPQMWLRHSELREAVASAMNSTHRSVLKVDKMSTDDYTAKSIELQQLSDALDSYQAELRNLPTFQYPQHILSEAQLLELAVAGPIVSFNTTYLGSHATLIAKDGIRNLPLPLLKLKDIEECIITTTSFKDISRPAKPKSLKVNGVSIPVSQPIALRDIVKTMRWLWDVAVKPILEELGLLWQCPPQRLPSIWWIGGSLMSLLPIHAAGYHDAGSTQNTLSHVISSYIPTLKALQFSRRKPWVPFPVREHVEQATQVKVLVVEMPTTPGIPGSLNTSRETRAI